MRLGRRELFQRNPDVSMKSGLEIGVRLFQRNRKLRFSRAVLQRVVLAEARSGQGRLQVRDANILSLGRRHVQCVFEFFAPLVR